MTKPSYEELLNRQIAMCDELAELVSTHRSDFSWQDSLEDVRNLKAELARVRGLLQRQYDLVRDEILVRNTVHDSNFATYTKQAFRLTATLRETELALAESADIGKLDRVDKSDG